MKIEDTKVSTRLIAGFGLVLGFLLLILGLGVLNLQHMHERTDQIVRFNGEETRLARSMRLSVTDRTLALRELILQKGDITGQQTELKSPTAHREAETAKAHRG